MTEHSILFADPGARDAHVTAEAADVFQDLNLDQIIAAVTANRQEYDLAPFFAARLTSAAAVAYRHEVMRDLEKPAVFQAIAAFSEQMRVARRRQTLANDAYYTHQKHRWLLDATETYTDAVEGLRADLAPAGAESRGLTTFREYLARYTASDAYVTRRREMSALTTDLSNVRYSLIIRPGSVTVGESRDEPDYSAVIEAFFAKFRQRAAGDYRVALRPSTGMTHVEAGVLDFVARLHPELFRRLAEYADRYRNFLDETVATFEREIQFYVAYLEYAAGFRRAGLSFCYPEVSTTDKRVWSRQSFDLALAQTLVKARAPVVCNDFSLDGAERILVVTGPNQGGKTTFARAFGQVHYLASLGCPVPGTEARLFLCDHLYTHFERSEHAATARGKLQDDLVRMHAILSQATPNSLVILNESFASTTVADAAYLSHRIMTRLSELDVLGVSVTFLDELASFNEKTVSMVAAIVAGDPTRRTFKLERRPADGLAYALAIAAKYGLTSDRLRARLAR